MVAGLLCDIGALLLQDAFPAQYERAATRAPANGDDNQCALEDEEIGVNHAEAGAHFLRRWKLAEELTEAIRFHHHPAGAPPACRDRAFNLHWHDWLNLGSLVLVSRVIACAARARENSRGAHYRADFPDAGDLSRSTYTRVRQRHDNLVCEAVPVRFTRVRPGESLLAV